MTTAATPPIHPALPQAAETADLLRFVTCGSVDDGKSTLIGRLLYESKGIYEDQLASVAVASRTVGTTGGDLDLALVTDGLRAEREQGITIDVAYRYFATPERKFIIADCPGHEQYTRNMATGASTANLAILLVDARKGVITQTRRHSFIVSLLGIRHVVVAVNKMDLVGYDEQVFRRIRQEFTEFSARLSIPDITFIPISALKGDNVTAPSGAMPWYVGPTLLGHLEHVHIASDRNLVDVRFPVQVVSRPSHDFRGFMGTLASGILRPGDEVLVLPSGTRSRVRQVLGAGAASLGQARPPMAITVTLEDELDVSRGDLLVPVRNVPRVSNRLEAMLVWMSGEPMRPDRQYVIKHCTRLVPGFVSQLRYRVDVNTLRQHEAAELGLNEIGRVELHLARPIAFDPYEKNRATGAFVVIDRHTHNTVGAGMILDRETDQSTGLYPGHGQEMRRPRPATPAAAVHRHRSLVSAPERGERLGQRPLCVWLTGLKGSGKTTIAYALERRLFDLGLIGAVLDGGNLRAGVSADLDFTGDDRSEHARRAAEVARIACEAGLFAICALITPFEADRAAARRAVAQAAGEDGFIEVFLDASVETCRRRVQEVYEQAEAGEINEFSGVTAPFEAPATADLVIRTDELSVEAGVERILEALRQRGLVNPV